MQADVAIGKIKLRHILAYIIRSIIEQYTFFLQASLQGTLADVSAQGDRCTAWFAVGKQLGDVAAYLLTVGGFPELLQAFLGESIMDGG